MIKSRKELIVVGILFLILLSLFLFRVKDEMVDFEVNYRAGHRIWLGETLYRAEDGHYQFKYSPFSALLYLPLSFLPLSLAKGIWYFLIILSYVFIFYLTKILLGVKKNFYLYTFLTFLILSKFILREIQLGQINAVTTMMVMIMVWFLITENKSFLVDHRGWAGISGGLATALKPYALIFFPYFLIKKQWKALFYGS
ncbi:MAG: glycosyltransferase family 87 protein, partial [Candidatus Aminicenantales bacterium]